MITYVNVRAKPSGTLGKWEFYMLVTCGRPFWVRRQRFNWERNIGRFNRTKLLNNLHIEKNVVKSLQCVWKRVNVLNRYRINGSVHKDIKRKHMKKWPINSFRINERQTKQWGLVFGLAKFLKYIWYPAFGGCKETLIISIQIITVHESRKI